jgi:hypothetical protein
MSAHPRQLMSTAPLPQPPHLQPYVSPLLGGPPHYLTSPPIFFPLMWGLTNQAALLAVRKEAARTPVPPK